MTTPREIFLNESELCGWLKSVVSHPNWHKSMTYARAELVGRKPSPETLCGALMFEEIVASLIEPDAPPARTPRTGLVHNIDVSRAARAGKDKPKNPGPPPTPPPKEK